MDRTTSRNDGRGSGDVADPAEPHSSGLHTHRWDLERPAGMKGGVARDKEEGERGDLGGERAGVAAGAEVAAGVGYGGQGRREERGWGGEEPSPVWYHSLI